MVSFVEQQLAQAFERALERDEGVAHRHADVADYFASSVLTSFSSAGFSSTLAAAFFSSRLFLNASR